MPNPNSPLGNVKGIPQDMPNRPEQPLMAQQPMQIPPAMGSEPLPDLSPALEEAQTIEDLVDFAQEIIASMVNARPEQTQAVAQRTQLLNQVYRLIEVRQSIQ